MTTLSAEGRFRLVGGPPNSRFQLLIWGARAPGEIPQIASREELLAGPLYRASQKANLFLGRFDAEGRAAIELVAFMTGPS